MFQCILSQGNTIPHCEGDSILLYHITPFLQIAMCMPEHCGIGVQLRLMKLSKSSGIKYLGMSARLQSMFKTNTVGTF